MAQREDLIVGGLIIGSLFLVGVLAWTFKKRGSPRREFKLRRVGQGRPMLRNKQTVKVIRDRQGRIQELEIHRNIHVAE